MALKLTYLAGLLACSGAAVMAAEPESPKQDTPPILTLDATDIKASNYEFYKGCPLINSASRYGRNWFPQSFTGEEFDAYRQIRVDYTHVEGRRETSGETYYGYSWQDTSAFEGNQVAGSVSWNFGLLTLSIGSSYENVHQSGRASTSFGYNEFYSRSINGSEGLDLSLRHPLVQWVSANGQIDYTMVAKVAGNISFDTDTSDSSSIQPAIGHELRLGDHWSLTAYTGGTIGFDQAGQQKRLDAFDYGAQLGYRIDQLRLPGVEAFIPVVELDGHHYFESHNDWQGSSPDSSLNGAVGLWTHFKALGPVSPKVGVAYVFPIDSGARTALDYGMVVSAVFSF